MTEKLFARCYPFRVAAALSGASPKAIRNWIDRGQISLDADESRPDGKNRLYSAFDIIRLAIARPLADFSWPVEGAWIIAMGVFVGRAAINFEKTNLSPEEVADRLSGRTIYAWRTGSSADFRYGQLPSDAPAAVLTVDVARIAREVLEAIEKT